jgi:ribosomal protein S18 acetylase RimI-like enzyme
MRIPPDLYAPTEADVPRVAEVYARAMAADPLNLSFFPSPRERTLAVMYEMIARVAVRSRMLHATSPAIEGAALWDFPGVPGFTARAMIRSGALRFVRLAGFRRALRMGRYEGWAHEILSRHTPPGSAHLVLLGVEPAHQGRGAASRLLRPVLGELYAAGTACCLETQNPENVSLYEHLGFSVALRTHVPGTEVGHWVMVRRAGERR